MTRVEDMLEGFEEGVLFALNAEPYSRRAMVAIAKRLQASYRVKLGYSGAADMLTDGASQQKLSKNSAPSYGLMLLPERGLMSPLWAEVREVFGLTGGFNLCPKASKGCAAACLSRSGQSAMRPAQRAQAVRTAFLLAHPVEAGLLIGDEVRRALKRHGRINLRLNTTSDIRWELVAPNAVKALVAAGVTMYDYTAWAPWQRVTTSDYSLTFSAKEPSHTSDEYLTDILADGGNVAMPFTTRKGEALPETWQGFTVIDGDLSDERYLDPRGVVVGLRAKGHEWKKDNSAGFIRQAD